MIRYLTAGESHGEYLMGIIEGVPANLFIDQAYINQELAMRQKGYGRSERMQIESDKVQFIAGLKDSYSTGNPIGFLIKNRGLNIDTPEVYRPRPGHGDLVGMVKYNQEGSRTTIERASARETASRVVVGSICKLLLREFGIYIHSHVLAIGELKLKTSYYDGSRIDEIKKARKSPLRVISGEEELIKYINSTKKDGDSLGGEIEILVENLPLGLGSYNNWDNKLDGKIAKSLMSVQGIKSVGIGLGHRSSELSGANYHDEIFYQDGQYKRKTNNAGGIEAGISNGELLVVRANMKAIPTLISPLRTVDVRTKEELRTMYERSDVLAVPSAALVCESALAYTLANEMIKLLGGDFMEALKINYENYSKYLRSR